MIVGLGLLNKDFVAVVPAWERDGKFAATHFFEQVGGPVPAALATMARLGGAGTPENEEPPTLIAVIGDDQHGDDLLRLLREDGVEASSVVRAKGVATSVSMALIDARDGSRTLANYAEALPPLTLTPQHEAILARAALLHLDGRNLPASLRAAQIVRANGGLVSLDLGTMRPGREALFPLCDIVIASQKGGAGAFPTVADDPVAQTRYFLGTGVRLVAGVTLGERGVVVGEPGREPVVLSAHAVATVRDTNGAGDVFHGAFLWAFLQGQNAVDAAHFAQAATALRIQTWGNRAGIPTRDAVAALYALPPRD